MGSACPCSSAWIRSAHAPFSNHRRVAGLQKKATVNRASAVRAKAAQSWPFDPDILIISNGFCEGKMSTPQNSGWRTRLVEGGFPDRSFDIEFWQEQGDEAIFAAAWELVELAEEVRNGRQPTLQRTATALKRI